MHRFHHRAVARLRNLYYWWLDYIYVSYWQITRALVRLDASQYRVSGDARLDPIVLIPGVYEKWHFMKPIADMLHRRGHAVHVVEALKYNRGTIEDMARVVDAYVTARRLESYVVVAHSKGGLIAKYILMSPGGSKMRKAITINTPFGGSRYAGLFLLKTIRVFLASSPIMQTLAANTAVNKKITSIYGIFDPHVPTGSYLNGATNIQIRTYGHFRIMNDPLVHQAIIKNIES